jgi:hypothetical protein
MLKLFLPLFIMLFLFQGITSAEFYKWEDEDGNVHITDYPPPDKSAKNIKMHKSEPGPANVSPSQESNRYKGYKTPSAENTKPRRSHIQQAGVLTVKWPVIFLDPETFISQNMTSKKTGRLPKEKNGLTARAVCLLPLLTGNTFTDTLKVPTKGHYSNVGRPPNRRLDSTALYDHDRACFFLFKSSFTG